MIDIEKEGYKAVITEGSSKGNQKKFYKEGLWIKIDKEGNKEGLAEEFVSSLENCIYDFPHVNYEREQIYYKDNIVQGCKSYNMYGDKEVSFITLRRLFRNNGIPLNIFIKEEDIRKNIENVVKETERLTGVNIFNYINRLLYLDCLIINEDRHYMNLGICEKQGRYNEALCFDNGSSLFCVDWTYRKRKTFEENIEAAKSVARPFSKFYDKQVEAIKEMGGKPLKIDFSKLNYVIKNYYNKQYEDEMNERIKRVILNRLEYYRGKGIYVFV